MKRSIGAVVGLAAAVTFAVTGCGSSSASSANPSGPITLTMAGWSLSTTPEFKTLADGFHAANPNVTVKLKEYDATNYDTQMIADLAAGKAPDVYILKNLKNFYTYQSGGQLLDVSDVANGLGDKVGGLNDYQIDSKTYAIPYRQDTWVLYYNKDLFAKAGVAGPGRLVDVARLRHRLQGTHHEAQGRRVDGRRRLRAHVAVDGAGFRPRPDAQCEYAKRRLLLPEGLLPVGYRSAERGRATQLRRLRPPTS